MDEGGNDLQDEERANETETEQPQSQTARAAPAGRGRITGTINFSEELVIVAERLR